AANILIDRLGVRNIQATVNAMGAPGMHVVRGVEDSKAFQKGLNNTTTSRALMTLMEKIARGQAVDQASSDEMLAILKRQTFNDRIPAGLPAGTVVAHKTGEITKIQHDAAIVYTGKPVVPAGLVRPPEHPLVRVARVRGLEDAKAASKRAADIPHALYNATQTRSGPSNATADLLAELIRLDTSNPPGKEGRIAEFLAPKFKALGFTTEIVPT